MAADVNIMEIKKNQEIANPGSPTAKGAVIKAGQWTNFLGDIKGEFSKISWTNPDELLTYTKIVVIGTFCFGMGIYIMDLLIQAVLGGLSGFIRLIGG